MNVNDERWPLGRALRLPRALVAYSERLAPITSIERRLERELDADVRLVRLWTPSDARANAADAQAVVVGAVEPIGAAMLGELTACRILVRRGVGVDNIDLDAATEIGLPVAFVPDASVEEVSDHALALLLALERRVAVLDRAVRDGIWTADATRLAESRQGMRRLRTLTLGILGLGRIGRALAGKAGPIYGRVIGHDPFLPPEVAVEGVELASLETVLAEADAVSLHVPLTPATRHLLGRANLARMKPASVLVNTARGGLVDEDALALALEAGHIAAAGLDVTEHEPLPATSPLLALRGVLVTAHSAAASDSSTRDLRERAVEAVALGLQGLPPAAIANPDVLRRANRLSPIPG